MRKKSAFQQILDDQEEKAKTETIAMKYQRQLSKISDIAQNAVQRREDAKTEFTQQLAAVQVDADRIESMRQKSASRANYLRRQATNKSARSISDVS